MPSEMAHEQLFSPTGEKIPFQPFFKNIGEKPAFQKGYFSAIFSPKLKESASGSSDSCHLNNDQFCGTYLLYPVQKDCARKKQINDAGQISCLESVKSTGKFTQQSETDGF